MSATEKRRTAFGPNVATKSFGTRSEWLAARKHTIGASEAAAVLGVSPYATPWQVWTRKRGEAPPLSAAVLRRGHRWEPAVLAEYEDESGSKVIAPSVALGVENPFVVLTTREREWLSQSPDAFAVDSSESFGQVEAKTAMHAGAWSPDPGVVIERWDDSCADLVPPHYAVQGYVQLAVSGLPWVDLCALVPSGGWLGVRYVRLERDEMTQGQIVEALAEWREKHLVRGEQPDVDGSKACNRYLAAHAPAFKKRPQRIADEDEVELIQELARQRSIAKAAESEAKLLSNRLLEISGGHRLYCGSQAGAPYGQPQTCAGRRTVDMEALRAEAPELVDKHTGQGRPYASFRTYRFEEK